MNREPTLRDKSVSTPPGRFPGVTSPNVGAPAGACDCHVHVFGPVKRYPFVDERAYTPMDALPSDAVSMLFRLGVDRAVLIQPSVYGADNTRLLEAMGELPFESRGVVVISPDADEKTIREMHETGIRGIRLNGIHWTAEELNDRLSGLDRVIDRITDLGWHVEVYLGSQAYPALDKIADRYKIDIVLDHLGGVFTANETIADRIEAFKRFKGLGNIWVKLSGLYRIRETGEIPERGKDLLQFMAGVMPDRLLWGSDWPHTPDHNNDTSPNPDSRPFQNIDAGLLLSDLMKWVDDPRTVQRILVDNPNALYQF